MSSKASKLHRLLGQIFDAEGHCRNRMLMTVSLELLKAGDWCWHPETFGPGMLYKVTPQKPATVCFNPKTRRFEIWTDWPPSKNGELR